MEKKRNLWAIPNNTSQNTYITNDEKPKDGDYGLGFALGIKGVGRGHYVFKQDGTNVGKLNAICNGSKKIILTDNKDLIKDGVQAIDDEFLECFVKNPSCERVEVEKGCVLYDFKYKIIIPKEEPKQETLEEAAERFYGEEEIVNDYDISGYLQSAFLTGAKWQQERMYSEEEVEQIIKLSCEEGMLIQRTINDKVKIPYCRIKDFTIRIFEQFKKK
jgi:hypothetical protein